MGRWWARFSGRSRSVGTVSNHWSMAALTLDYHAFVGMQYISFMGAQKLPVGALADWFRSCNWK